MKNTNRFPNLVVPKTAILEMTYNCNHRCVFCSVPWSSPKKTYKKLPELTIREWKNCINILLENGVREICFTGGEATLKPGLKTLIAYAKKKKIDIPLFNKSGKLINHKKIAPEIYLITNGKAINKNWVNFLKKYSVNVTVSLPGIDYYKELTGGGDYKKALSVIKELSKNRIKVVVAICVTKNNLSELFKTIALGFLAGAKGLLLNRFLPGGRGLNCTELCLNKEEIIRMLDIAEEACIIAKTKGSIGTELPKCIIINRKYKMINVGTKCSGGVDFFAIDPSGKVRPCNHSPIRTGDYKNIKTAIKTKYWQRFKKKDFLPEKCLGCYLSLQCDGGCREAAHIVGGKIDSPDPLFL